MTMKKSSMVSCILLIAIAISSVFSNTNSLPASSTYCVHNNETAAISSVRHELHNDIPEPKEICDERSQSSAVIQATRKSGRHFLRPSDRSLNDGYIACVDPSQSSQNSVFFYQLSIHPGDVIIQYIHDQDGEKDRAFL